MNNAARTARPARLTARNVEVANTPRGYLLTAEAELEGPGKWERLYSYTVSATRAEAETLAARLREMGTLNPGKWEIAENCDY
jgi:hypothetical protein